MRVEQQEKMCQSMTWRVGHRQFTRADTELASVSASNRAGRRHEIKGEAGQEDEDRGEVSARERLFQRL
jgi:hypothetical protein